MCTRPGAKGRTLVQVLQVLHKAMLPLDVESLPRQMSWRSTHFGFSKLGGFRGRPGWPHTYTYTGPVSFLLGGL